MKALPVVLAVFLFVTLAHAQYGGGTGMPNDPYLIYSAEQMNTIGLHDNHWCKHFKLMFDIDLSAYKGTAFNIIGRFTPGSGGRNNPDEWKPFTGVFDGNDHVISNFTFDCNGIYVVALFRCVGGSFAQIRDLGLMNPDIRAEALYNVGSLVGRLMDKGTVVGCYVEGGRIEGSSSAGGLVGSNDQGMIKACHSTATVSGNLSVGGLVGSNSGTITNCHSTGYVSGNGHYPRGIGGLVGWNFEEGAIRNCVSTGRVSGFNDVGGLVGGNTANRTTISNCCAMGSVSGDGNIGGLIGVNTVETAIGLPPDVPGGAIWGCYATGFVAGNQYVGGLVGYGRNELVASCYWDIETSGQTTSAGGEGMTTAEMQDINTYVNAGWDFVDETFNGTCDYWRISPDDYPQLCYHDGDSPVMPEGLGTVQEPYLIRDARDVGTVWFKSLASYRLEQSLDLSGITWSMAVVPQFEGTFDGNGYVINNLHIRGGGYLGLFGQVGQRARISNLGLEVVEVNGIGDRVGGLVADSRGTITGCYATGNVSGKRFVGGLVGENSTGSITLCHTNGTISGDKIVGGLVGTNYKGDITMSYSDGMVIGSKEIGGLVGMTYGQWEENYQGSSMVNCYSSSTVSGSERIGGLIGTNQNSELDHCYSTSAVNGDKDIGGLVGYNSGSITESFWDIEASGLLNMCGFQSAYGTGCDSRFGKTTTEMQAASTFLDAGWDFVDETANGTEDIWWILEGQDYPRLWWEVIPEK